MATRVTIGHGGEATVEELQSTHGGVKSSADFDSGGITVRSSEGFGATRSVAHDSQIADRDLIRVGGVEMLAGQAREFGLLPPLVSNPAGSNQQTDAPAAELAQLATETAADQQSEGETGHADFDATAADLHARVSDGLMDQIEASDYETVAAQLAFTGLDAFQAVEMTNGLREGTINPLDMDSNQKAVLKAVEEQIHTTAARSARAELGQERFQRLESIAAVNPEVAEAVEGYAIHRSLGQHEDSWADFYAEVESFVSGNR